MSTSTNAFNKSSLLSSTAYFILAGLYIVGFSQVLLNACKDAFTIRMKAIEEYGRVIHEFDPYFNYRAAEYLWQHGSRKFFHWFDYQSWYPLGRPVGTTIYPGMQFTSMWIKMFILPDWSINDICCLVPAWFGVFATLATAAVCYVAVDSIKSSEKKSILQNLPVVSYLTEKLLIPSAGFVEQQLKNITGSTWGLPTFKNPPALESAVFTACIMSVVPAHLMRSIGGGYDNESVATTAMQLTFWFWVWTLASPSYSIVLGTITGFAYLYMVAAWGGYVFVINLIGIHALILFLLRLMPWDHLYKSYTSFYLVGTLLAIQVPVVGWTPIKSLEQLGPLGVFLGFQGLQLMRIMEQKYKKVNKWKVRISVVLGGIIVAMPVIYYLYAIGYFGPISSRVRGLFVKHTKTGNPLVDSVAEHQAASPQAYEQYLDVAADIAPIGFGIIGLIGCTPASSFLITYGVAAYFFSHRMVRLILLTAPIASICGGITLGYGWAWAMSAIFGDARPSVDFMFEEEEDEATETAEAEKPKTDKSKEKKKQKKNKSKKDTTRTVDEDDKSNSKSEPDNISGDPIWTRLVRLLIATWFIMEAVPAVDSFRDKAEQMSHALSHPTIIMKHGDYVIDDYRQAYFWLRDNTPEDARIMAWWDYGYQITGIANRTTIADGNTWNHEHIALLGRILTSPLKDAHRITRHLADYVLVWAGGGGDDVAKSPHLRRIANSVYRGLCREPTCRDFGFYRQGEPTPSMEASLLYNLHSHNIADGVEADRNRFKEVYMSKNGKVRIFKVMSVSKESKEWVEKNRKCDAPGSWFCPGQYPPALEKILKEKQDFAQLEDFNRGADDAEYQKQYFENLK
mmetsp:Transcript_11404/g.27535  ORF Transcript_11404/g.27535 Transcript_11404/m.27535 type:complete len:851 (-) Transcript_11404:462-3014(-)